MNPCSVPEMPRHAGFREAQSSLIPSAPASDEEFDMTAPTPQRCRLFHHPPLTTYSPLDVRQLASGRSQHRTYLVVPSLYINATVPVTSSCPLCVRFPIHASRSAPFIRGEDDPPSRKPQPRSHSLTASRKEKPLDLRAPAKVTQPTCHAANVGIRRPS